MLTAAAVAHDAASGPVAVIGGGWFALGVGGLYQRRKQVQEVVLDGETVRFRSAASTVTIPVQDIVEVSWPGRSRAGGGYLQLRTRAGQAIKVPGRLQHLVGFVIQLSRANPEATTNL